MLQSSLGAQVGLPAQIAAQIGLSSVPEATGDGGNIQIVTEQLRVADGAAIIVSTFSKGNSGNLTVRAQSIELAGGTANRELPNGLFADTQGEGAAGNITITGNSLEATAGGQVRTTTSGSNNAGDINLFIQDRLLLSGTDSGVFANTTEGF